MAGQVARLGRGTQDVGFPVPLVVKGDGLVSIEMASARLSSSSDMVRVERGVASGGDDVVDVGNADN